MSFTFSLPPDAMTSGDLSLPSGEILGGGSSSQFLLTSHRSVLDMQPEVPIIPSTKETEQARKIQQHLTTLGQLHFPERVLFGRSKEMALLKAKCVGGNEQTTDTTTSSTSSSCTPSTPRKKNELIVLSGLSGAGKTELAWSCQRAVERERRGIFAVGKYELHQQPGVNANATTLNTNTTATRSSSIMNTPYKGIAAATNQVLEKVLAQMGHGPKHHHSDQSQQSKQQQQFKTKCRQTIDAPQIRFLLSILPALQTFWDQVPDEEENDDNNDDNGTVPEELGPEPTTPLPNSATTAISSLNSSKASSTNSRAAGLRQSLGMKKLMMSFRPTPRKPNNNTNNNANGNSATSSANSSGSKPANRFYSLRLNAANKNISKNHLFDNDDDAYSIQQDNTMTSRGGNKGNATTTTGTNQPPSRQVVELAFLSLLRLLSRQLASTTKSDASSTPPPLVIFVDDVQWADSLSMDLIKTILLDESLENIIIIAACRSDEVQEETHIWNRTVTEIRHASHNSTTLSESDNTTTTAVDYTEIPVANLSVQAVHEMLQECLSIDASSSAAEQSYSLAEIVHKRTLGNVYFVKLFLMNLTHLDLLKFNLGTMQWSWDAAQIEQETAVTDNVISLLHNKLQDYSSELKFLLKVASCLGSSFHEDTLRLIYDEFGEEVSDNNNLASSSDANPQSSSFTTGRESMTQLLKKATEELLLEEVPSSKSSLPSNDDDDETSSSGSSHHSSQTFRFVHDKVQEATLSLQIEGAHDMQCFQGNIGWCLYRKLAQETLEEMMFAVTHLLNQGCESINLDLTSDQRADIASMNAQSAEKATSLGAFFTATRFVNIGIQTLMSAAPEGSNEEERKHFMWKHHSSLALKLHSVGAVSNKNVGQSVQALEHCQQIVQQESISILDKVPAYIILVEKTYQESKHREASDLGFDVLLQLGCEKSMPRTKLRQRIAAKRILNDARKSMPTPQEIRTMNLATDPAKKEAVGLMVTLAAYVYMYDSSFLYTIILSRCVQMTRMYGLTHYAASAFGSFSNVLMHSANDWNAALVAAECAKATVERFDDNHMKTTVLYKTNTYAFAWCRPVTKAIPDFRESYRLGLLSGNIEGGAAGILGAVFSDFVSGAPLPRVESDFETYLTQMLKLDVISNYRYGKIVWDAMRYLLEKSDKIEVDVPKHPMFAVISQAITCIVYSFTGNFEEGSELALKIGNKFGDTYPGAWYGFEPFGRGLCLFAEARRTKDRKYAKAAAKVQDQYRSWIKNGGVNFTHLLCILDAEQAALRNNRDEAEKAFRKAILLSARGGFIQYAALANERYATYLKEIGEKENYTFYMKEASKLYQEWGATRVIKRVKNTLGVVS